MSLVSHCHAALDLDDLCFRLHCYTVYLEFWLRKSWTLLLSHPHNNLKINQNRDYLVPKDHCPIESLTGEQVAEQQNDPFTSVFVFGFVVLAVPWWMLYIPTRAAHVHEHVSV